MGATEIIALDLGESDNADGDSGNGLIQYVDKLSAAIVRRQKALETALAEARGVPVYCIELTDPIPTPIWAFNNYPQLIAVGYETTRQQISSWDRDGCSMPLRRHSRAIPFSLSESI